MSRDEILTTPVRPGNSPLRGSGLKANADKRAGENPRPGVAALLDRQPARRSPLAALRGFAATGTILTIPRLRVEGRCHRAHATRTLAFDFPFADERTVGCRNVLLDPGDHHEVVTQKAAALRTARQQGQRRRQRALLPGTHPNVDSRSSSTAFSASEMEPRPRKPPADSAIRRALPSTRSRINERSPGSSSFSNLVE